MSLLDNVRDPLTGLLARTALKSQVERAIAHTRAINAEFALIVLDLDHFKSINDAFGHQRGDRVLSEFAQRATDVSRSHDILIRYGGDEFVALLPASGNVQAMAFAGRLLDTMRSTAFQGDPPVTVTLSAGIAVYPHDGATFDELFAAADRRHYIAKHQGRATIVGDDQNAQPAHLVESPSRLIERDHVIALVHQFLDEHYAYTRPILRVRGTSGVGHTRILAEIRQAAAMRGIGVLALRGTRALQGRMAGALSEMLYNTPLAESASYDPQQLGADLQTWLDKEGLDGLVVTLDDTLYLDEVTLDIMRALVEQSPLERLALVIAEHDAPGFTVRPTSFEREIRLLPMSANGFRTWVRQSLRWEPPDDVLAWFHGSTDGLPALFWRGLRYLLSAGILSHTSGNWTLSQPLDQIPFAEYADEQLAQPPHNLSHSLSPLVGRATDLRTIHQALARQRVVAIVGPGGLGKTRLALQAGAELVERFPDGVFFVDLAEASSDEWIIAQIARTIGLRFSSNDPITSTLAALRQRSLLMLLDNCEHISGLDSAVTMLLQHIPGLKIILTSRDRPSLADCAIVELGGLDLPLATHPATALYSSSVQLFVQRARRVQYAFDPDDAELAAISQICRLLDGMPLGIELAAGWVTGASCQDIARMLTNNLRALATQAPDLADRHQRIFAAIDTFWERLASSERAMLRPLALFRGGFQGEAAQVVAGASPFFLSSLVTSGYLRRNANGRYEMHELLRQYAQRQLHAAPRARRDAETRYVRYYAEFVRRHAGALMAGGESIAPFRAELDNIVAAWDWAIAHHKLEFVRLMSPGLSRFWELVGLTHVGEPILARGAACLRQHLERLSPQDMAVLSHLVCRLAWYQTLRGVTVADALLRDAYMFATTSEFDDAVVEAMLMQCWKDFLLKPETARARLEQALELGGSPTLAAECRRLLGIIYSQTGHVERGAEQVERSLQQFVACGDRLGEMRSICNLIFMDVERLLYSSADRRASRLLTQARAIGSTEMECMALAQLGLSALYRAAVPRADSFLKRADVCAQQNGDRGLELYCLELRCVLAEMAGAPDRLQLFQSALTQFEEYAAYQGIGVVETFRGHHFLTHGNLDEARRSYLAAERAHQAEGQAYDHVARAGLAHILFRQGHFEEAVDQITELLDASRIYSLDRLQEPFVVPELILPVLEAVNDPRCAAVRAGAQTLFERRLAAIEDPAEHHRYSAMMRTRWSVLRTPKPSAECYTVA